MRDREGALALFVAFLALMLATGAAIMAGLEHKHAQEREERRDAEVARARDDSTTLWAEVAALRSEAAARKAGSIQWTQGGAYLGSTLGGADSGTLYLGTGNPGESRIRLTATRDPVTGVTHITGGPARGCGYSGQ